MTKFMAWVAVIVIVLAAVLIVAYPVFVASADTVAQIAAALQ